MNLAKILIVDHEQENLQLMAHVIENAGCGITRNVFDLREAVHVCQQFEPDLVLIDLQAQDNFSVIRQIHETSSSDLHPMILVFSTDHSAKTRRRALGEGAHDFLTKPLDRIEFLLRCRNLLHARFAQQHLMDKIARLEGRLQQTNSIQFSERGNFMSGSNFLWAIS